MAVVGLLHETEHKELYPSPIITPTCSSIGVTVDYVLLEEYLAATRSGSSETTTIGHQNRDGWDAVRRTPGPGRKGTPAMQSHVESEDHGGYGMEGGIPGMLGTPLSRPETLWVSIDETSMKHGWPTWWPQWLSLLHTDCDIQEWPTFQRDWNIYSY